MIYGRTGTGKSSTTIRFVQDQFVQAYDPTIEDSYRKRIQVEGREIVLEVYDTTEVEEQFNYRDAYVRTAHGCVMLCAVDDVESVEFGAFVRRYSSIRGEDYFPLVIGINKMDLDETEHRVTRELIEENMRLEFENLNGSIFEISAKTGLNVLEMMKELVRRCEVGEVSTFEIIQQIIKKDKKVLKKPIDQKDKCSVM